MRDKTSTGPLGFPALLSAVAMAFMLAQGHAQTPAPAVAPAMTTPAPEGVAPANPFVEAPVAATPQAADAAAEAAANQEGEAGFANPFAEFFQRRQGMTQQPAGRPSGLTSSQQPQQYEPPHELVAQMRQALAEQRYSDVKNLAEQYAVVDPQSGLADFFMQLARIREDTIAQRREVGGLFLAQYGSSRMEASGTAVAAAVPPTATPSAGSGVTATPTPSAVPSGTPSAMPSPAVQPVAPVQTPVAPAETPAIAAVSPTPVEVAQATPTPEAPAVSATPAVAPVSATPAPAMRTPAVPAASTESWLDRWMMPGLIALGALVVLAIVLMLLRKSRGRKAEPVAEAPAAEPAATAAAGATAVTAPSAPVEEPVSEPGFESPFAGIEGTEPTDMLAPDFASESAGADAEIEPETHEPAPSPTGQLPSDMDESLEPSPSDLEFKPAGQSEPPQEETASVSSSMEDTKSSGGDIDSLLSFIPAESQDDRDKPSALDVSAFEAPSEPPPVAEDGGLHFEDLVTAPPSQMGEGSKGPESSFSLNDFESVGDQSNLGEESGGSLSFDDVVIPQKASNAPADESLSSLDLNNLEFPSKPEEVEDSYISDYDSVSDAGSEDVEQTKGFQQHFENLMFSTEGEPQADATQGRDKSEETTDAGSAATQKSWPGAPDDTRPSDLGGGLEETTGLSQAETENEALTPPELSLEDTLPPTYDLDTEQEGTPPPPPEEKK